MPEISALLARTLILAAHPDDETAAGGVLLQRMREPIVVFATDGGPQDTSFWDKCGSREAYVELREREARVVLGMVGIHDLHYLSAAGQRIVDQQLFRKLAEACASLGAIIERTRPEALLTHAYEGGHPDHDACSVLIQQVAREQNLPAWEFPLYHRSADGVFVPQTFLACGAPGARARELSKDDVVRLRPTGAELERKRRMLKAYASQQEIVRLFTAEIECFRPQPVYDYSRPPHAGKLNYQVWGWAISPVEVSEAFSAFLHTRGVAA